MPSPDHPVTIDDARSVPGSPVRVDADGSDLAVARELLRAEAAAVSQLVDRLGSPFPAAVRLIEEAAATGGHVVVTGVGKSGLIGAKISATFASLGVPSHYIHPTDAAHGDLGRFRLGDLCLALSYSGMTEEVVALAATIKQDGIPIIAITRGRDGASHPASALEELADAALAIGPVDETTALSPAPMCSSTAMAALGDALAIAVARRRNFTDDDFAKRHPGGTLGGLLRPVVDVLRFRVGDNLTPISDDISVHQALELASGAVRRPGALLLVDAVSGALTGIFTDADLRRLIVQDPTQLERPIRDVMTASPGSLPQSALVRDAVNMVRKFRRDEIPVVDDAGRPVGLLDVQDLIALKVVERD